MKYKAVIFDLFGTLIDSFSENEYLNLLKEISRFIFADYEDFRRLWLETYHKRVIGEFPTTQSCLEYIAEILETKASEKDIQKACKIISDYNQKALIPRKDVSETMRKLKELDYKIGLITDCSESMEANWDNLDFPKYLDVAIFSYKVGLKKPDPRIYELACKK